MGRRKKYGWGRQKKEYCFPLLIEYQSTKFSLIENKIIREKDNKNEFKQNNDIIRWKILGFRPTSVRKGSLQYGEEGDSCVRRKSGHHRRDWNLESYDRELVPAGKKDCKLEVSEY